jgi:hypothetical protein
MVIFLIAVYIFSFDLRCYVGITDPSAQARYLEKLVLQKTALYKPNLISIHALKPNSQLREVSVQVLYSW